MKIKGVVEDLKIKKKIKKKNDCKNIKSISRTLLLWCCGQCEVSSFSDSSLVRLIFLKIYRPLLMQSLLTTWF